MRPVMNCCFDGAGRYAENRRPQGSAEFDVIMGGGDHTIPLNNRNRGAVSYGSLRFLLYLCQALGLKHEGHIRQTHRFPVLPEGYNNAEVEY